MSDDEQGEAIAGLDLRSELARIDRDRAETAMMQRESNKFIAEQRKLIAEAQKYEREHAWYPWLQLLTVIASSAAIGAVVARLIH